MFTGIVQAVGTVKALLPGRILVEAPHSFAPEGYELGESISVSGCCLTVVSVDENSSNSVLAFDMSPETYAKTSLGGLDLGSLVNLERAMNAASKFGGHIVQGHVDATGTVLSMSEAENSIVLKVGFPRAFARYLIDKGSIAVDGISLTVVDPTDSDFTAWIIPHTLQHTNLKEKSTDSLVNLEFDLVAKYVENLLKPYAAGLRV